MSRKKKDDKEPSPQGKLITRISLAPTDLTKLDEFLEHEKRMCTQYYGEEQSEGTVLLLAAQELLNFMLGPLQMLEQVALDKADFEVRPPLSVDLRHAKECLHRLENLKHWNLHKLTDLAKQLGVTTWTLRRYRQKGLLKAKKIGAAWWVTDENFNEFVRTYDRVGRKGKKGKGKQ